MSGLGFLLIIVAFAFLWLVMVRPQKRRQVELERMLESLRVGDEVLTAGGIYGEVVAVRGDEIVVEIAPEIEVRVARRAIGAIVSREDDAEEEPSEAEEAPFEAADRAPEEVSRAPGEEERG
ncbi:MAG: preprotein translocase subunit YajC [Thermoleophilia bacterium]|nr:preprotein translocase subunit YajC [Thermoleophilia bacterium]